MSTWCHDSWQKKSYTQLVHYPDPDLAQKIVNRLASLPPLVHSYSIEDLKKDLFDANAGKKFILQGGDCAESFARCRPEFIQSQVNLLRALSDSLAVKINKPVITIGRIAGQYAKPRSMVHEQRGNQALPSYRGDMINQAEFNEAARLPDPEAMLRAYDYSKLTLQYLSSDFYTSHEALHLPYESALTRPFEQQWLNLATHFPWVGYRTNDVTGAHVEYLRGLNNPVAVKIGPGMAREHLIQLIQTLNPRRELGRLTLIHRFGVERIQQELPALILAAQSTQIPVLWLCDPMHGNTKLMLNGRKTRWLQDIFAELNAAFAVHKMLGSDLNGVHLEITAESVHECFDRSCEFLTEDLMSRYTSLVDPRLNAEQADAVVKVIASLME